MITQKIFDQVIGTKENFSLLIIENVTKKEYLVIRNKDFRYDSNKIMLYYEIPIGIYCIILDNLDLKKIKKEIFIPNADYTSFDHLDRIELLEELEEESIVSIPVTSRIQATKDNIIKFYNDILVLNKLL
jgi:hypothetical protein